MWRGSWWVGVAGQTGGFDWPGWGCGAATGSGQERGSECSYCSAGGQMAATVSVGEGVRTAPRGWRLGSELACCHRHWGEETTFSQWVAERFTHQHPFSLRDSCGTCSYKGTCQLEAFCKETGLWTDWALALLCWNAAHETSLQTHKINLKVKLYMNTENFSLCNKWC